MFFLTNKKHQKTAETSWNRKGGILDVCGWLEFLAFVVEVCFVFLFLGITVKLSKLLNCSYDLCSW